MSNKNLWRLTGFQPIQQQHKYLHLKPNLNQRIQKKFQEKFNFRWQIILQLVQPGRHVRRRRRPLPRVPLHQGQEGRDAGEGAEEGDRQDDDRGDLRAPRSHRQDRHRRGLQGMYY